ncbi:hypothetical protein HK102_002610 [Quaeritorhiza haematococci]|nr:hypothetical protein HK102_002610 [Quaeritorhiza haematococci]
MDGARNHSPSDLVNLPDDNDADIQNEGADLDDMSAEFNPDNIQPGDDADPISPTSDNSDALLHPNLQQTATEAASDAVLDQPPRPPSEPPTDAEKFLVAIQTNITRFVIEVMTQCFIAALSHPGNSDNWQTVLGKYVTLKHIQTELINQMQGRKQEIETIINSGNAALLQNTFPREICVAKATQVLSDIHHLLHGSPPPNATPAAAASSYLLNPYTPRVFTAFHHHFPPNPAIRAAAAAAAAAHQHAAASSLLGAAAAAAAASGGAANDVRLPPVPPPDADAASRELFMAAAQHAAQAHARAHAHAHTHAHPQEPVITSTADGTVFLTPPVHGALPLEMAHHPLQTPMMMAAAQMNGGDPTTTATTQSEQQSTLLAPTAMKPKRKRGTKAKQSATSSELQSGGILIPTTNGLVTPVNMGAIGGLNGMNMAITTTSSPSAATNSSNGEDDSDVVIDYRPQKRRKWTEDEIAALEDGMRRFRMKWSDIEKYHGASGTGRLAGRNQVALKDKARSMKEALLRMGKTGKELGIWVYATEHYKKRSKAGSSSVGPEKIEGQGESPTDVPMLSDEQQKLEQDRSQQQEQQEQQEELQQQELHQQQQQQQAQQEQQHQQQQQQEHFQRQQQEQYQQQQEQFQQQPFQNFQQFQDERRQAILKLQMLHQAHAHAAQAAHVHAQAQAHAQQDLQNFRVFHQLHAHAFHHQSQETSQMVPMPLPPAPPTPPPLPQSQASMAVEQSEPESEQQNEQQGQMQEIAVSQ